jgi:hypothetical protein
MSDTDELTRSAASLFVLEMLKQSPGKTWTEPEVRALCEEGLRNSPEEDDRDRTVDDVIMLLSTAALVLGKMQEEPERVWKEEELLELEANTMQFYVEVRPPISDVIQALVCVGLIPPQEH